MADFDLRTLGRKSLLIVAILSMLAIGEMILVSAEEPAASVQQQAAYKAPPQEQNRRVVANLLILRANSDSAPITHPNERLRRDLRAVIGGLRYSQVSRLPARWPPSDDPLP
jgi:hypothetical protein